MKKQTSLTDTERKALQIVRDHPGISASYFAELMWPDSHMHSKVSNQGHGATRGKAAWLCGGSYLGKLRKKEWVTPDYASGHGYRLSSAGAAILKG